MAALNGYLALGVLSAAGVFTEISGALGYARQAISLAPASAGSVQNASTVNFPVNSGSARWPAYGAYAVYDAATGGNVLFAWNIYPGSGAIASRSPLPGRRHTIPAGTIKLEFPAVMSEAGSEVVLSKPFLWTPGGLQRFEDTPVAVGSGERALGDVLGSVSAPRPVLAALGDSITDCFVSGTQNYWATIGYLTWVRILTRQRFYCPPENEFGVAGNTTGQMLTRIGDVLAARPSVCIVEAGTNDCNTSAPNPDGSIANLDAIYIALESIGCRIIAIPITGRTNAFALPSNGLKAAAKINTWIKRQGFTRRNFYVADCGLAFDDPKSTTWAPRAGYTQDDLHPNSLGAYVIAMQIKPILDRLYPDWFQPFTTPADLYDATYNPTGNLLPNGSMSGTSGTWLGSNIAGAGPIASNWQATDSQAGGATVVASKITLADGRDAQRFTFSGSYAGNGKLYEFFTTISSPSTKLSVGDILEGGIELNLGANQNIAGVKAGIWSIESGTTYTHEDGAPYNSVAPVPEGYAGILLGSQRKLIAVPTTVYLHVVVQLKNAASQTPISGDLDLFSAFIRKVI